jgi:hypothetical protein
MLKTTLIAAAAAAFLFAGSATAQTMDANGRCHDAKGQFAKAEVCGGMTAKTSKMSKSKGAKSAMTSAAPASATAAGPQATTAAGPATTAGAGAAAKAQRCKNDKGKFAKCGTPGAHPA